MSALLSSVWNAPAASPPPPRRVWRDYVLVAVIPAFAVLEGVLRDELPWAPLIVVAALAPTLLWRRTMPLTMLAIAMVAAGILSLVLPSSEQPYTSAYFVLLIYSLPRWGSGRAIVVGLAIVLAQLGISGALTGMPLEDTVGSLVVVASIVALGFAFRFRGSARMRELERARLLERERLARDLHDTVAHHVSAIAIRAQAGLAMAESDPATAPEALRVIEAEASRTLAEMRTMVRVLRLEGDAELAPSPRVADLQQLAHDNPGPAVEVHLAGDVDGLPPTVGSAVYRLAQESVTNARRHARHATRIQVRVEADDQEVRLKVSDDGEGAGSAAAGYGITGMKERATLLGGTCTAGRSADGGWVVTAVLPRKEWVT